MNNSVDKKYEMVAGVLLASENTDEAYDVRPKWEDGTPAHTRFVSQVVTTYGVGEVPITEHRKIAWKSAIKELLWIYRDQSNSVKRLGDHYGVHYWDDWAKPDGTIGKGYGYQMSKKFISPETGEWTTQMRRLLDGLKDKGTMNRRLIIDLYDVDDLSEMALTPCAFLTMWTVRGEYLDLTLVQRSGDFLAAASPGGINAFQYYVLLRMVAQVSGLKAGSFMHLVQNMHIYDRHEPLLRKILFSTLDKEPKKGKAVELWINPEVTYFFDFKPSDFKLLNYEPNKVDIKVPVAV